MSIIQTAYKYERKSVHDIKDVYKSIKNTMFFKSNKESNIFFCGDVIRTNSQRYQTFLAKPNGLKCACCGIKGLFFAKERAGNVEKWHLNLYALDKNGQEVLMTKDHIIPRSKGGRDVLENYQTMCIKCNEKKGNRLEK